MGAAFFPILFFTCLWGGVGIGLPFFVPKTPNQSLIRCILMITGACCWLFWLCCYMAQMNPLIGPKLDRHALLIMAKEWGDTLKTK